MQFTYHSYNEMIDHLKRIEDRCPGVARTYSIGRSTEGRELLVVEFSDNPGEHELREYHSFEVCYHGLMIQCSV